LISGVQIAPILLHQHPFGCPAYVLDHKVQGGFKATKWQVEPGWGFTWDHPIIILILRHTSGLVSPQFHFKFDDELISVARQFGNTIPTSDWHRNAASLEDQ
jgi:hypothetical protein